MNTNQPGGSGFFNIPFTKRSNKHEQISDEKEYRLPLANRLPDNVRNHFIAMCGEFVGTVLFLFFALSGTQVANTVNSSAGLTVAGNGDNPQQLEYIALCFGFSLAVNAWVFFRISGGLFNPAVTVGMCLIGALPWFRGALLFVTQIIGGIVAAALVSCMFPGDLNVRTTLGGGTTVVQGLFIEMFLTAQLVFTIFMLAAEKHKGTFIAPVGIGLALFVAELTGVYFTGGSLNPARTFGPAVVDRVFKHYHWIYWLGPMLGSIIAAGFYKFIKALEYETANPDQDIDHATKVENKKQLLVAAGLPQEEAQIVAQDLATTPAATGGVDGAVMANGQGRKSLEADPNGMYGTAYLQTEQRPSSEDTMGAPPLLPPVVALQRHSGAFLDPSHLQRHSGAYSGAFIDPSRPSSATTGITTSLNRLSYLRDAARRASYRSDNSGMLQPGQTDQRKNSPAPPSNDEVYARFAAQPAEALGGAVLSNDTPKRNSYSRTISSGV